MAWSAPRTWVSGEIPTAAQLNTDLRDNPNELALHSHSGGSGSGTAALGNLVSVTFIDAAAPAAPGGTLTRVYSSSTSIFWRNAGGIFGIATAGHEHAIASGTVLVAGNTATAATAAALTPNVYTLIGSAASATLLTQTATIGGTGSRAVVISANAAVYMGGGGGTDQVVLRVSRDATIVGVLSTAAQLGTQLAVYALSTLEYNRPAGSCTYLMEFSLATTTLGTGAVYGRTLHITEVRQA